MVDIVECSLMNVFLTGANGFVGKRTVEILSQQKAVNVYATMRQKPRVPPNFPVHYATLERHTDWSEALRYMDVVIHTAARVDKLKETSNDPHAEYKLVNVDATLNFARQAASAGVQRFVFLSSIKVNGDSTWRNEPFMHDDFPLPSDAYGMSKFEAEKGLSKICSVSGMEFVIIRPPLVYGPNVKGNFSRLIKIVQSGIPLPLSSIDNKRSFIGLDNLVDLLMICMVHPKAANQVLLASDGYDLSTPELIRNIAQAMGRHSRLFPCPPQVFRVLAKCIGKKVLADRLLGSLQVEISNTKRLLGWEPPVTIEEGIRRCFPKF